jgi:DNA-binding GntR family transcriptional regulator
LAKKLGVSSIPFREAIRLLEKEGFVEVVPFKGARVKALTREELVERAHIAFALESHAVELTQPTLTQADLDRAAELAKRVYPTPDVKTWFRRIDEVLAILYGAGRWPMLFEMIQQNRMAVRRYTELLVRETIEGPEETGRWASGHFPRLIELVRQGDLGGARAHQRRRFEEYVDRLLPFLERGTDFGKRRGALRSVKRSKAARSRKQDLPPVSKK